MKYGIMTFHWATNHGAILQTYATVRYLQKKTGEDCVYVIDYKPSKYDLSLKQFLKPSSPKGYMDKILNYIKEKRLSRFRKTLPLTERYYSIKELRENPPSVNVLVCGSDQVWNPHFTMRGENNNTPSLAYYLDFCDDCVKRYALSVSFGTTEISKEIQDYILPALKKFDAISVRENTGKRIMSIIGFTNVSLVADPTALLSRNDILKLCKKNIKKRPGFIAVCVLRRQSRNNELLIANLKKKIGLPTVNIVYQSLENWLSYISESSYTITNSFHCTMMCLKLHKKFFVIEEDGVYSGMNDRLVTLLSYFGLNDRIIKSQNIIIDSINNPINWEDIDKKMDEYKLSVENFIEETMKQ